MDTDKRPVNKKRRRRVVKPLIYRYHDYREFLTHWLEYSKQKDTRFSLRQFAKIAKLSPAYLSMILMGHRPLTGPAVLKLAKAMDISNQEADFFSLLQVLGDSDSQDERIEAFKKILKTRAYKKINTKEVEVYRYLSKWWNVAIRELAVSTPIAMSSKQLKNRLIGSVSQQELNKSLKFLLKHDYLRLQNARLVVNNDRRIECVGGVYKLSMRQYHHQLLNLAKDSIDHVPSSDRGIYAHTMAIPKERWPEFRQILLDAVEKIASMSVKHGPTDEVYYFGFLGIPLTLREGDNDN